MYATHKNCLICSSNKLVALKNYSKDYLTKCTDCGFVFCSRIPTIEELEIHYKKYQRGREISPITIKRYNELLDEFEKYRIKNNILDIGCGDGYFLEEARKRGWNTYGTEFSDEAINILKLKGIEYKQGSLNPIYYSDGMFDVITSFEVIEHINNPIEETKNINTILRGGGLYYITTPNFNSFSRFSLRERWKMIEYPEHLSYYSPNTLNTLLKKCNFKNIKIITSGVSLTRYITSKNNAITPNEGHLIEENLREKSEKKTIYRAAKLAINYVLNLFKIGDALKAYYIKKN